MHILSLAVIRFIFAANENSAFYGDLRIFYIILFMTMTGRALRSGLFFDRQHGKYFMTVFHLGYREIVAINVDAKQISVWTGYYIRRQ